MKVIREPHTYAQNRLHRSLSNRRGNNNSKGDPIPGVRTNACLARLVRRKAQREVIKAEKAKERMIIDERIQKHSGKKAEMHERDFIQARGPLG